MRDDRHAQGMLAHGELEVRLERGLARIGGVAITLSVRESALLATLVERAGGILTREELSRAVWGQQLRPGDRSVDVYVSKLRAKLERALPAWRFIHTHAGVGYRFEAQDHGKWRLLAQARGGGGA